jgi:selenocysteine-specific elongation factor
MHVLGTAGHVDHGKSSIVRALSGIDPDRLPEEKARGLTIDLGFAWFETPAGPLGVVDVPGHERFVRTMIAGAGGIDIVLLVIAADDGWMPQTQEHLEILRLLDVRTGIIVLSKIDLVDTSWLDLVEEDIRQKTKGTFLAGAPIVRTDVVHGVGLEELRAAIAEAQKTAAERADIGRARLAVDRVFSMPGQGTVVTGTLRDGSLAVDQSVHLFPSQQSARVRGLQTHRHTLKTARPGSRVAANLAGLDTDAVHRGFWLSAEEPTPLPRFVGVELETLAGLPFALKSGMPVLVIFGTTEASARLVLPQAKALAPGTRSVAQFDLRSPLAARFGDRFIVRLPSPQVTVGGGRFLQPSVRRYGAPHAERWDLLRRMTEGGAESWLKAHLAAVQAQPAAEIYRFYPGAKAEFDKFVQAGSEAGRWRYEKGHLVDAGYWKDLLVQIDKSVREHHRAHPSETGPPSAEVLSTLRVPQALHDPLLSALEAQGIRQEGPHLCHQSHRAGLTGPQKALADRWRSELEAAPFNGPTRAELLAQSPEARATLDFLLKSGKWTELKDGIIVRTADFDRAVRLALDVIRRDGSVTVATFRDAIGATRKYALPILDRCDRLGYTRRDGDLRMAGPRAAELETQHK